MSGELESQMFTTLPEEIPNHLLTCAQIPSDRATWQEIVRFAQTFNGYKEWGSFEQCVKIANAKSHETLTDLRTCLFFEQRRPHHSGDDPDAETMKYIQHLLASIRTKVINGSISNDDTVEKS